MKFINWSIRVVLFLLLFGLALKNTGDVTLNLFFDYVWRAPLILLLLVLFALGALLGMMTVLPLQWRKRRNARATLAPIAQRGGDSESMPD